MIKVSIKEYFYQLFFAVILYINTSGTFCEAVLYIDPSAYYERRVEEPMQHSTCLHDLIEDLFNTNKKNYHDLKGVAVLNGPGSYTGLRVGLAAAKGFCYSLNIPLILISKLSLLCSYYNSIMDPPRPVGAIQFARTDEFFFTLQTAQNETKIRTAVQDLESMLTILKSNPDMILVSGSDENLDGLEKEINVLEVPKPFIYTVINKRLITKDVDDLFTSEPFYLKKVHANTPKRRFL